MVAQSGKDLLIKINMDTNVYQTVAGLRATRISLNQDTVDATHTESGGWRELLAGGVGIKSAAVSGSGVFRDEATDARVRELFWQGATPDYQIVIPSFGLIIGPFLVASLEYAGSYDGEATYEMSFASAGVLNFAPA